MPSRTCFIWRPFHLAFVYYGNAGPDADELLHAGDDTAPDLQYHLVLPLMFVSKAPLHRKVGCMLDLSSESQSIACLCTAVYQWPDLTLPTRQAHKIWNCELRSAGLVGGQFWSVNSRVIPDFGYWDLAKTWCVNGRASGAYLSEPCADTRR